MTRIVFSRTEAGAIFRVDLRGHAGFAEAGEDIVCSAITSAMQLTHILLEDIRRLDFDTAVEQEETHIRITLPEPARGAAQDALEALCAHYHEMQKEYAEFITVLEVQQRC